MLLNAGADVNARKGDGQTPLLSSGVKSTYRFTDNI